MMGLTAFFSGCQSAPDLERRIDELYGRMPQEERIAQLRSMYMDELFDEEGKLDTAKCRELIPYGIGHFSQFCMHPGLHDLSTADRTGRIIQHRTGGVEDASDEYRTA